MAKKVGAPEQNKNAEKWSIESATELFNKCLETAKDKTSESNDFIGEVAQEHDTTLGVLDYLTTKYPELMSIYTQIKQSCESNCFRNGKNNKIHAGMAIMNLKSNHGWTDRSEVKQTVQNIAPLSKDEIDAADKKIDEEY